MNKEKLLLIEIILNVKSENYINALYEVIVRGDWDYIEDLFPTKQDFKEFIDKYKGENNE